MEDPILKNDPHIKPLIEPLTLCPDRGEFIGLIEPLILSESYSARSELADLTLELSRESASLQSSIPPAFVNALATLVRSMNCYYSNLIEGHDTHPIDIEKALKKDYSQDPVKRNLQLEAEAHIAVQAWIDEGGLSSSVVTVESLVEIHRRFCDLLPPELLWVEDPDTLERIEVVPGKFRERDVQVGKLVAISPGAVPRFLQQFSRVYGRLGKSESIIASAASHHRLLWIHPFLDGNGRVARLMSYGLLREALGTSGIWSIARGLARKQEEYKQHLMDCDEPRRGDFDGRGNLSQEALASFTRFFLQTCLDQVSFMRSLVRPDILRARVLSWAREETGLGKLPPRSAAVLESLLLFGELPRGEIQTILNTSPATARRVISALSAQGVLVSDSSRAPVRLAFPATLASSWLPGLFPER
jgi:Fic family protein